MNETKSEREKNEASADIRIYQVLPKDFEAFRIYDPLDRLDLAALPGTVVLGAVDLEDRKDPETAGLLIATLQEDRYLLEWLAVSPHYRGREVGAELLDTMFAVCERAGLPFFSVCCTREITNTGDEYFSSGYFERREETGHAYRLPVKEFFRAKGLPKQEEDSPVVSLKDLRAAEWDQVREYLKKAPHRYQLCAGDVFVTGTNNALSCAWIEDGKVHGVLLLLTVGRRHYPVAAAMDSPDELNALVAYSTQRAKALELDEEELIVLCSSHNADHFMQGYAGNEMRFYRRILTAEVSEYPVRTPAGA